MTLVFLGSGVRSAPQLQNAVPPFTPEAVTDDAYTPFPDSCPERRIGEYHLVCYGYELTITGGKKPWTKHFDGTNVRVFPLTDRVLLVQAAFSGSLSFVTSRVVRLEDGYVVMDNDGGLIYHDGQTAVFVPTESGLGLAAYRPTLYLMNLKTLVTETKEYSISPRPGCGGEDDVTLQRDAWIVRVHGHRLVFPRQDLCGSFEHAEPLS